MATYTILSRVQIWHPPYRGAAPPGFSLLPAPATAAVLKTRHMPYVIVDGELQVWTSRDDPYDSQALPGSPSRFVFYLSEGVAYGASFPAPVFPPRRHAGYYFSNLGDPGARVAESRPDRIPFMGDTGFLQVMAARHFTVDIFTGNPVTGCLDQPVLTGLEMHFEKRVAMISLPLDWLPIGKYRFVVNGREQVLYHDPLAASQGSWGVAELFHPLRTESLTSHKEASPLPVFV